MPFTPPPAGSSTPRPPVPWFLLDRLPAELIAAPRWIAYLLKGEKKRKVPAAYAGDAWPLRDVLDAWEPERHHGVGFRCFDVPLPETGVHVFALDVDACVWPMRLGPQGPTLASAPPADWPCDPSGLLWDVRNAPYAVASWAAPLLRALLDAGAWVEVTGSGEGLRVLWLTEGQSPLAGEAKPNAPGTPNKAKPGVSIYSHDKGGNRWVALTGQRVEWNHRPPAQRPPLAVLDLDALVVEFFQQHFADPSSAAAAAAAAPAVAPSPVSSTERRMSPGEAAELLASYEHDPDATRRKLWRLWVADPETIRHDPSAAHFELLGGLALLVGKDPETVRALRDMAPGGRWAVGDVAGSHDGEKYAADSWLKGELRRALGARTLRDSERRAMLSEPIDDAELDRLAGLPPPPAAVHELAEETRAGEPSAEQIAARIAAGGRVLGLRWDSLAAFVAAQCEAPVPEDETDDERAERAEHERARAERAALVAELDRVARLPRTARRFEPVGNYLGEARNSPAGPFVFQQKRRARLPGYLFDGAFVGAGLLCLTARPKAGKSLFLAYAVAHLLLRVPLAGEEGFALLRPGGVPVLMIATEDGDAATARILAAVLALAEQRGIDEQEARAAVARLLLVYDAPLPGVASSDHATRAESAWQLHLHREVLRERSGGVDPLVIFDTWTRQIEEGQPDTHEKALAPNAKAFVAALTEGGRWHVVQTRHGGHDRDKCDRPRDSNESLQTVSSLWWCAKLGDTWTPSKPTRRGPKTPGGPGAVATNEPIEPIRSVLSRMDPAERGRAATTFAGWVANGAAGDVLLAPSAEQRHGAAGALPVFLFAVAVRDVVDDDGVTIPGVPYLIARDVFVPGRRWTAPAIAGAPNVHGFTPWTGDELPSHQDAPASPDVAVASEAEDGEPPPPADPKAAPSNPPSRRSKTATPKPPRPPKPKPPVPIPPDLLGEGPPPPPPSVGAAVQRHDPDVLCVRLITRIDADGGAWSASVRSVAKLLGIGTASLQRYLAGPWSKVIRCDADPEQQRAAVWRVIRPETP